MSRLPPRLDYLVIYNATLKSEPTEPGQEEDEDAEEKAHILFHAGRLQTVSRDRILRQVGLAKALTNFSESVSSIPGSITPDAYSQLKECSDPSKDVIASTRPREGWS